MEKRTKRNYKCKLCDFESKDSTDLTTHHINFHVNGKIECDVLFQASISQCKLAHSAI